MRDRSARDEHLSWCPLPPYRRHDLLEGTETDQSFLPLPTCPVWGLSTETGPNACERGMGKPPPHTLLMTHQSTDQSLTMMVLVVLTVEPSLTIRLGGLLQGTLDRKKRRVWRSTLTFLQEARWGRIRRIKTRTYR